MARRVSPEAAVGFLRLAEEFLASARANLAEGRFNAAGFDGIQAAINANDALTAHFLGMRASLDHREAIRLHVDVVRILGDRSQRDVLKRLLDRRSAFGYLGTASSQWDGERVLRDAVRFVGWVRRQLEAAGVR